MTALSLWKYSVGAAEIGVLLCMSCNTSTYDIFSQSDDQDCCTQLNFHRNTLTARNQKYGQNQLQFNLGYNKKYPELQQLPSMCDDKMAGRKVSLLWLPLSKWRSNDYLPCSPVPSASNLVSVFPVNDLFYFGNLLPVGERNKTGWKVTAYIYYIFTISTYYCNSWRVS